MVVARNSSVIAIPCMKSFESPSHMSAPVYSVGKHPMKAHPRHTPDRQATRRTTRHFSLCSIDGRCATRIGTSHSPGAWTRSCACQALPHQTTLLHRIPCRPRTLQQSRTSTRKRDNAPGDGLAASTCISWKCWMSPAEKRS
jgi:hypothetical protein